MRASVGICTSIIVAVAGIFAFSPRTPVPMAERQIPVENMNITSLAQTSAGLVAAGELGNILISRDDGDSWKPATLSSQRHALLTRLYFQNDEIGFAMGHEGWVLRTTDGGLSWDEVAFDQERNEPLLDIGHLLSGHWLAIGGYGKLLSSVDQGKSWTLQPAPEGTDWHLNTLISSANKYAWLMAGEVGTVFRSLDGGESWEKLPEFYNGSFYGGLHLGGDDWLLYGMRGNIFRTSDNGSSWRRLDFNIPVSLFTHEVLADGQILLAGQGGMILSSTDNGQSFQLAYRGGRYSLTDLQFTDDGKLVAGSDQGIKTVSAAQFIKPATTRLVNESKNNNKNNS